jgi:hypothetical protein
VDPVAAVGPVEPVGSNADVSSTTGGGSSSLQAGRSRSGTVTAIGAISLRRFAIAASVVAASVVAGPALGRRNLSRAGPSTGRC